MCIKFTIFMFLEMKVTAADVTLPICGKYICTAQYRMPRLQNGHAYSLISAISC